MTGIDLPKGGGALKGIGETFRADLHTGTGRMSVPIPLPPGRGAISPTLELTYASGSGDGPCGRDWSLAVPEVSRRTDRGVPVYDDERDTFVHSGAEELVPVPAGDVEPPDLPEGATVTRYRPRTEAAFARLMHVQGPLDDYWEIWSHTGLRSRYGTPRPADAAAGWADPATVRGPDGRIFSWLLSRTTDPVGNLVVYTYRSGAEDGADGGAARCL